LLAVPGDITQKGFEKKKNKLLAPFLEKLATETAAATAAAAAAVECQQLPAPPPPEQLEAAGNGTASVAAADSEEPAAAAAAANSNKARGSRRTHRRYYNEKRYHSEASIKGCDEKSKEGKYTVCAAISLAILLLKQGYNLKGPFGGKRKIPEKFIFCFFIILLKRGDS
jgi:hypothetical protein